MAKNNTVICRYAKCKHNSKELPKEEAVKIGAAYYHKDCAKIKEDVETVVMLFINNVNPNTIVPQLRKVVNNIIFDKGIDSDFLVFALRYYIDNKYTLNYPGGLYYVIQNKTVLNAYASKIKKEQAIALQKANVQHIEEPKEQFTYTPTRQRSFTDILGK